MAGTKRIAESLAKWHTARERARAALSRGRALCREAMPEGPDGRAAFCAYHRAHPTDPTP